MVNKHLPEHLAQMQAMPLEAKILMTQLRIRGWYDHWNGEVYVSFSGGKDSTVLLHIARSMFPDIEAVFVDTGLEYPEIRQFVKKFDNIIWLRPELSFKQVCLKYGFPFISKDVSQTVNTAKRSEKSGVKTYRWHKINGTAVQKDGSKSLYNMEKWKPLIYAPFEMSSLCCNVMKKKPAKKFHKETGKYPITAQMANESRNRRIQWMKNGCNGFDMKSPISNPMSFWTEQDVLQYIKKYNLEIASVYGDIVVDEQGDDVAEGQITVFDILGDYEGVKMKTTGCKRTGCMFCGFGCHVKGDTRFLDMKETHPRQYAFIFKPEAEGGLGYAEKIDYINENCNTNIQY